MADFKHSFGDALVKSFVYDGRRCIVTQHPELEHYCGYARTRFQFHPDDIRLKGVSLIEVNGGLNYGVDSYGFVGFDCGHSWDECYEEGVLVTDPSLASGGNKILWNLTDVVDEVEYLADQLTALERFVEKVR